MQHASTCQYKVHVHVWTTCNNRTSSCSTEQTDIQKKYKKKTNSASANTVIQAYFRSVCVCVFLSRCPGCGVPTRPHAHLPEQLGASTSPLLTAPFLPFTPSPSAPTVPPWARLWGSGTSSSSLLTHLFGSSSPLASSLLLSALQRVIRSLGSGTAFSMASMSAMATLQTHREG